MTRSTGSLQARIPPALRPAGSVVIGVVLALHGAAHSLAFLVQWKLMTSTELSYQTTVLGGRVDLGDIGIRVVGLLWLVAAFGFIVVGVRVAGFMRLESLPVGAVAIFSLALCLLGLPEASVGVVIDAAILGVLALVWTIRARRAARLKGVLHGNTGRTQAEPLEATSDGPVGARKPDGHPPQHLRGGTVSRHEQEMR